MKNSTLFLSFFFALLSYTTAQTKPATSQPARGENMAGISDTRSDTLIHPPLLTATKDLNLAYVRMWIEGGWSKPPSIEYFKISRQWRGAVYAVANFQNSTPRCSAVDDRTWIAYWSQFPEPKDTGISVIQIGNEINTNAYYNGTQADYARMLKNCYSILHKKGYLVELGSDLDDTTYIESLHHAFPLLTSSYDRLDIHAYYGQADAVVNMIDKGIAVGKRFGKPCDCSEWGVRNIPDQHKLAAETGAVMMMLTARDYHSVFFHFSLFPIEPLDATSPFTSDYQHHDPFWMYQARHQ